MEIEIEDLLGKTITEIEQLGDYTDELRIVTSEGEVYLMFHEQDCCERVYLEDIAGDLEDLIGEPLTMAECVTNSDEMPSDFDIDYKAESFTWTYYKLATIKGYVTLRWFGESNGYYSENVSIVKQ